MPNRKYNPFKGKFTTYYTEGSTQFVEGTETRKQHEEYYRFSLISETPSGVLPDDADLREVAVLGDGLYIFDDRGFPNDPQWYPIIGGAGGYTHPLTHPATMITEDAPNRLWYTQTERDKLAGIEPNANNYILPTASDIILGGVKVGDRLVIDPGGVLSADLQSDENFTTILKTKLENIEDNANDYTLPISTTTILGGVKVGNRLGITAGGILSADLQSDENFTGIYKSKLDSVDWGANLYTHPITHPPSIITEDANHRFVTDAQIAYWNNKMDEPLTDVTHGDRGGGTLHELVDTVDAGFMAPTDKVKLDTIESGANNYTHPATHPAVMIDQSPAYRFVTDAQISDWTSKLDSPLTDITHGNLGGGTLHDLVTPSIHGFMSAADKTKLDGISGSGVPSHTHLADPDIIEVVPDHLFFTQDERDKLSNIEDFANKYVHPLTHPATIIVQDSTHRFVSDAQIADWDSKLDSPFDDTTHGNRGGGPLHPVVTPTVTGFMSTTDKNKLDAIEAGANNYVHPATHSATMITEFSPNYLFFTQPERNKLAGIEDLANKYIHPANHPATMITEDGTHRFVTDVQISGWDNKIDSPLTDLTHGDLGGGTLHNIVTPTVAGFMSTTDKVKLNNIEDNANNYIHPSTHLATMIDEVSPDHLFFTQYERDKLAGLENNANNYVHPATHPATMIVEDATHRFATDTEKTYWNNKIDGPFDDVVHGDRGGGTLHDVVTITVNGFMSATDKDKLDNIDTNANEYIHPATHPASMIVQDTTHRFVTDTQISYWNAKADSPISAFTHGDLPGGTLHAVVTSIDNGFMSSSDKDKLDGIEAGANNYTHPATHPANIIIEDSNHRFTNDTAISKLASIEWNANYYIHPITDGYLHVPATSTTNLGKVLTAGPGPMDISWQELDPDTGNDDIHEYDCEITATIGKVVRMCGSCSDEVRVLTDNRHIYPAVGVIIEKLSDTRCKVQHFGKLPDSIDYGDCQAAERVWLSTTGNLTSDPPDTGYLQILGFCTSDCDVFLDVELERVKQYPF